MYVSINGIVLVTCYRPVNGHCIVHCAESLAHIGVCSEWPVEKKKLSRGHRSLSSHTWAYTKTNPQVMCALFSTKMTIWYCSEKEVAMRYTLHTLDHSSSSIGKVINVFSIVSGSRCSPLAARCSPLAARCSHKTLKSRARGSGALSCTQRN